MANNQSVPPTHGTVSHGKLVVVVVAAALVVVLALVSAFAWPGWALNKSDSVTTSQQQGQAKEPTKPTIDAVALPEDASELLKAMPDSVLNYARTKVATTEEWSKASPIEEYTITYSTGTAAKNVTMVVAQWSNSDTAEKQYSSVVGGLTGKQLGAGNVKVSGKTTGSYVVKVDTNNEKNAVAVWQNDTVVFQVSGAKDAVQRFYAQFPL